MQSDNLLIQTIDTLVQESYRPNEPGAAVIVVRGGEAMFRKGQGMANLGPDVRIEPDTVFRLGSITKQFTTVATLMPAEQGKLDLDDSISKFLPDYPTHSRSLASKNAPNTAPLRGMSDVHRTAGALRVFCRFFLNIDRFPFPSLSIPSRR